VTRSRDTADTQDNLGGAVAPYVAGKNKIINGDFGVWQRGTSFSAANALYTADRWNTLTDKTTSGVLTTQQSFSPGTAPVAGYEGQYFFRTVFPAGNTYCIQEQRVEDVRTFAGQTVTLSFWAKADASVAITPTLVQKFGTSGSADVETTTSALTLTTSWVRYSVTASIPSISGKTIGSGNYLAVRAMRAVTASGFTIDIWGVQVEAGSVATPFTTASGSIGGELALCQRYFQKSYAQGTVPATNGAANGLVFASTTATAASTSYLVTVKLPVVMRTSPTLTIYSFTTSQTGRVSDGAGTDLAAGSGGTNLIADSQFTVQNSSGGLITAAQGGFVFHYVANGEL